ncbi:MAG: hypothetical protein HRU19_31985 [Pseudobacteriovorax sp.]|nr:hypothetical protein [Pseudobacteriovorax sp.]
MKFLILVSILTLSTQMYADSSSIRCNKKQTVCEIKNKRTTIGDRIGIFSKDGFFIGWGVVTKIRDSIRTFEIKELYSKILRSHRAEVIRDREARNPKEYFKIRENYGDYYYGGKLGLFSMGIGNGFVASNFEAVGLLKWQQLTFLTLKLNYLSGSGEASAKLQGVTNTNFSISSIGIAAGAAQILFPYEYVNLRLGGDLGFASTTVDIDGGYNIGTILNDRIVEGTVFLLRGEVAAVMRFGDFIGSLGVDLMYLHQSFNTGLSIGVLTSL